MSKIFILKYLIICKLTVFFIFHLQRDFINIPMLLDSNFLDGKFIIYMYFTRCIFMIKHPKYFMIISNYVSKNMRMEFIDSLESHFITIVRFNNKIFRSSDYCFLTSLVSVTFNQVHFFCNFRSPIYQHSKSHVV